MKTSNSIKIYLILSSTLIAILFVCFEFADSKPRILIFSKTTGYRHESIPSGIEAIKKLGAENGFEVDTTENATNFNESNLKNYSAVIFLSTTMEVLNEKQQVVFERYIQGGGGYVGIHAAADTEYNWPWYNKLVGAYFLSHPEQQKATVKVIDRSHPSTKHLKKKWERFDEWYNYKQINPDIKVLAQLDESTYKGGKNGKDHPIVWYHEYDGGRAFYTGLGHTKESYADPDFLKHILGGIKYAIGNNTGIDFSKSHSTRIPDENRFRRVVLTEGLNEPMELAVANDGRVFFLERRGAFKMWDPTTKSVKLIKNMPVFSEEGNGLLGITLDPDFAINNQLYLYLTDFNGAQLNHKVSRFILTKDNEIDMSSEKVIIRIPIEYENSAHTGGSLLFDEKRNLWISTGDNTIPFKSNGFAPLDQRGNVSLDAQRSAGNTNDLRGKILKIHPQPDGTYTIPDGNLFPKDGSKGKPEIYVMGCRNPYRMAYDKNTGYIYWGEIGPDSGKDSIQGPRGYDEINQARTPGNFGWPYFVADNKPYRQYDFETQKAGAFFDPLKPVNNSPNNKGARELPPAQKALIWYPYAESAEFPSVGKGGRMAVAGAIYHYDKNLNSSVKFPEYYDNKLFIMEWMRGWVKVVSLDKDGNYQNMEEFMSSTDFDRPIDMEFGPDGSIYMLEYGENYGVDNADASLVKIEYISGNRAPVANIVVSDSLGATPLKVTLSSEGSFDYDEDDVLSYQWSISSDNNYTVKGPVTECTFTKPGVYQVTLTVTDAAGLKTQKIVTIKAGNSPPQVSIDLAGNQTFFWEGEKLRYTVRVSDKEDGKIDTSKVNVYLSFVSQLKKVEEAIQGHQQLIASPLGKDLMAQSDCKACHTINTKSAGPSFMEIAKRYPNTPENVGTLADKIIKGGAGNWGNHAMAAHPQLTKNEAAEMVKYILSLTQAEKAPSRLPKEGELTLKASQENKARGVYILSASYTDKGTPEVGKLTGNSVKIIRNAQLAAISYDNFRGVRIVEAGDGGKNVVLSDDSFISYRKVDLKDISSLTYSLSCKDKPGIIEVRLDSPEGILLSSANFTPSGDWRNMVKINTRISPAEGIHDLYFVFKKTTQGTNNLCALKTITFNKESL